ncbi:HesA/MoeB/ThiF family protein [Acuticoccus sp.]|uniref:HesA/MoeB/ThiF family protein n=1 Tax=Acuticoccus sp. TaxID=1904378 RepID=UPI003B518BD6
MTFSPEEVERYARHLVLADVGGAGQQRLRRARVLVVGAGGLGSPVIAYLAAAGVGTIRVADDDTVALSNLQRQVLHGTPDLGRAKVESAADAVTRLNPDVVVEPRAVRLTEANAAGLIAGSDVVADGSDNAATRLAVADAAERARVPLVSAAVSMFSGHVTTLTPHEARPDGTRWPALTDLFPTQGAAEDECAVLGILGVVTGVIGTLQANEVLKLLLGIGEPLRGRLLMFDARDARFEEIAYGPPT